jgi:hypothetical protein
MSNPETNSGLPKGEPLVTLTLEIPIQAFGRTLVNLRFMRRPKARDIVTLQKEGLEDAAGTMRLIHWLTGVPMADLEELDGYDFARADRIVDAFLRHGPMVGKSSSLPSGASSQAQG